MQMIKNNASLGYCLSLITCLLYIKQCLLNLNPTGVTAQFAIAGNHAMARNYQADGIFAIGIGDRAKAFGVIHL